MLIPIIKTLPKLKDGESFSLPHRGSPSVEFVHRCCDCKLEHRVKITKTSKNFLMKFWRMK